MSGSMPAVAPPGRRVLAAIPFAVFVVTLGYRVVLPVLPPMVARLAGSSEPGVIARHPRIAFFLPAAAMAIAASVGLKLPGQPAISGRVFRERPTEAELVRQ